jgi:hypothetical protein
MPTPRAQAGAVTVGEKINIIGGQNGGGSVGVNEVYFPNRDDGINDPWDVGLSLPSGRYGMGVTNIAGNIFIIGGNGENEGNINSLQLPPNADQWLSIETLTSDTWTNGGLTSIGNRIYIFGGKFGDAISDNMLNIQAIYTVALPIIK